MMSLGVGIIGYHGTESMGWLDAYVASSMILTGMGPTGELHTTAGKIFSGLYALYSGVIFLLIFGLIAAPVAHRMLHYFHFVERD